MSHQTGDFSFDKALGLFGPFLLSGLRLEFGLGKSIGWMDRRAAYVSCGRLLQTLVLKLALSPR